MPTASMWIVRVLAGIALAVRVSAAEEPMLVALTADGSLLRFSVDRPPDVTTLPLTGVGGRLLGLARRATNDGLYGVDTVGDVYRIDPSTGAATLVSSLTVPFAGGSRSAMDINPKTDRMRLVGAEGQNLRLHVDNGAAAIDRPVAYARQDPHFGDAAGIAATAYTNDVPGAGTTEMLDLDSAEDLLVRQEPPNDGTLVTIGPLGVDVPADAGFEIVTDASGRSRGFAAFRSTLYEVDLATGHATPLGTIGGPSGTIAALASVTRSAAGHGR